MKVAVFSTRKHTRQFLNDANSGYGHQLSFFEPSLSPATAVLAEGFPAVSIFVNDQANSEALTLLHEGGTRLLALRCAGFNQVDLARAGELDMAVVRVPAYSPHAVAEHTIALMLALNRKIHRAYARVREGNFALDGLMGFDMFGRTVGVVGTGRIGGLVAQICHGFGCQVLACDVVENPDLAGIASYVSTDELIRNSDIVTLHCPLTPQTRHIISEQSIARMKNGVMLVNTSRGALINAKAIIPALKAGKIAFLGLDVYEEEADLFFQDLSDQVIHDDVFARLLTFPNVIVTGHQAFFTREAVASISQTTLASITAFEQGRPLENEVTAEMVVR